MNVSNVTTDDGRACISLIKALNVATFRDVSGKDLEAIVSSKAWLQGLANQMAAQLKGQVSKVSEPAPQGGFKVKSMGKLPVKSGTSSINKKKKK